ncbi:TPA: hypothetical protein ENS27_01050, partial [bacterium]|nr:hypothetical protein [bacterium]
MARTKPKKPRIILLILFLGITQVDASISKTITNRSSISAPIAIPPGFSITLNNSFTYSGNISIKSPSGSTKSLTFTKISGPYSSDIDFNEIGTYEVTENYSVFIVSKSLVGEQTTTSSESNTWTYNNINTGTGKFKANSSVTNLTVSDIVGPISYSIAGTSLPITATITTTGMILQGETVSATISSLWTVNSSIEAPAPTGTIIVNTNKDSATFNVSGPSAFSGGGKSTTKTNALVGQYTINYGEVAGYTTPPSETKVLALGGTITFDGQYIPKYGSIEVNCNIDQANFEISGPEGISYNGSGKNWSVAQTLIGKYIITFMSVFGYKTPQPSVQTLSENGKITFTGNYEKLVPGTIEVNTNLDEASFFLNGASTFSGSGRYWLKTDAPVGQYTIVYNEVDGYETPDPESKTLNSAGTIVFTGEYKKIYPGTIEVNTNIDEASFIIHGPVSFNGNGKFWDQFDVPVGTYTITYNKVDGYRTPPTETKTLKSGGKIIFNAKYRQIFPNAIEVYTNLDEAEFDITGPANYSGGGTEWIKTDVPVGDYTIRYKEVSGYKTPPSLTQKLLAGEVIIFIAEYIPHTGKIVVQTNLDEAIFEITGRENYRGSGKEWIQNDAPIGEYTITYGNVPNYISPPSVTQRLNQNGTLIFTGEYEKYKPGIIEVRSNISQASFTILGPMNYEGQGVYWKNDNAPPGEYIIFFDDVPNYDKPPSQTKQLESNQMLAFNGNYVAHTGIIVVNTNSDDASFVLSGPNDVSYNGKGKSWTQADAPVGDYTIEYNDLLFYGKPPSEMKSLARDSEIQFMGQYNPIPPTIQKVTVSGSPATTKSTIRITVTTDTMCSVTFSIDGIISGKLNELANSGNYTTSFNVPIGFDVANAVVNIRVVNGINLEATDSSQAITIDTLAQIKFVGLSKESLSIGDNVAITVIGDPKSNVSFSIKGITQGQMQEDKNNLGTYSATFTVLKEIDNIPIEIRLIDPSGNFAVNTDKIISTKNKLGVVKVTTNLDDGTFVLTHIETQKTYEGKGRFWEKDGMSAGDYSLVFESVLGYNTPQAQSKTLRGNETITFDGEYSIANGTIVVRTNLEEAKFKVKNSLEYNGVGQSWTQSNVEAGQYTIIYEEVKGYETPTSETKMLEDGGRIAFIGGYKPKYGTIEVVTNLEEAKFEISGVKEYIGSGKKWSEVLAPEGEYKIEFHEVPGYITPPSSTRTVSVGCNVIFYGNYSLSEGAIIVRTNLESAEF